MSTVTLSPEVVQSLKQQMKEIWMEVLPEILPGIIKETTPILAEVIKEIIPIVVKASAEQLRDENVLKQQHDRKFEEFKLRHKKTLDEHLNKKTGMYKKFLSFDWHIQLYEQYLAENSYVPRIQIATYASTILWKLTLSLALTGENGKYQCASPVIAKTCFTILYVRGAINIQKWEKRTCSEKEPITINLKQKVAKLRTHLIDMFLLVKKIMRTLFSSCMYSLKWITLISCCLTKITSINKI